MRISRRRRGFEKAGSVPAGQLGLPARRARELALQQGWEHVAGSNLSRHVKALRVDRGVLRLEAADRRWYDAVEPLLPQLSRRLAATQPQLGVKKYRLGMAGVADLPEARAVPEVVAEDAEEEIVEQREANRLRRRTAPPAVMAAEVTTEHLKRRLEVVARRYADRKDPQKA